MSDYVTPNGSQPIGQPAEEHMERIISALQADQRPPVPQDLAPEDAEAAQMAAMLRGTLSGHAAPRPTFARNLRDQLERELFAPETPAVSAPAPLPAPQPPRRAGTSRRNLIRTGLAAAAGLAAGVAGGVLVEEKGNGDTGESIALVGANGVWLTVANVAQIPLGSALRFTTPQLVGHVVHYQDGTFAAFSAACTHMGCIVAWNSTEHAFDCPCHNGRFDDHGRSSGQFLYKPLPPIQVRVVGEDVQVFVPPTGTPAAPTPSATPDSNGGYGHDKRGDEAK